MKSFQNYLSNICYLDIEDDSSSQYKGAAKHNDIINYAMSNGFELYDTIRQGNTEFFDLRFINKKIPISNKFNNISLF